MSLEQLMRSLGIKDDTAAELAATLEVLEEAGDVARNPKGLWWTTQRLGLLAGVIRFSRKSSTARLCNASDDRVVALVGSRGCANALNGDYVLARVVHAAPGRALRRGWIPEARVVRVLKRAHNVLTGILRHHDGVWQVEPDDAAFGYWVSVSEKPANVNTGDRVRVVLDEWLSALEPLRGQIDQIFGPAGVSTADREALLSRHGLRRDFPVEVQKEIQRCPRFRGELPVERRSDLRWQDVITIDPEDAKDHDDAIFVERLAQAPESGWAVWVHIADVAHYVSAGSALDREAFARATSVYLPGEVIPMLPPVLSNDLCSLRPGVDRLAISVRMEVSRQGVVRNPSFHRSLIHVRKKLSYGEALDILNDASAPEDAVCKRVRCAAEAAAALRKFRFSNGALDLDFPETKVCVDASGRPVRVERIAHNASHQLIEELMLAANETVASKLKNSGRGALYRIHEAPDPDRLLEFRELLCAIGVEVGNLSLPGEVQRMLLKLKGREDEQALKIAFLRSLRLAVYHFEPLGHYGLAKANYTHFTSPIRRYPDLVVHRCLGMLMGWIPAGPVAVPDLQTLAEHCSMRERIAASAENEAVRMAQVELLEAVIGTRQEAVVLGARRDELQVQLVESGFEGFVTLGSKEQRGGLPSVRRSFPGKPSGAGRCVVPRSGERILVEIAGVDRERLQVEMRYIARC